MNGIRALASQQPRACRVEPGPDGRPSSVDGCAVEDVREEWRVEEGWWSTPIRRRCFSLVLAGGRCCTVYEDRRSRTWWRHGS